MNYQELYLHSWLIWLLYDCFKLKVMPSLEVCLMRYVPTLYFPNHLKHLELTALTKIFRVHVGRQGPPPPEGFGEYKKAGGAGGVLGLLQQIIQEAKHMEAEAIRDEDEAQQKYEGFVKETNNSVETKGAAIVNKNQDKADTEQSLTQANSDHASETTELETLSGGSAALHQSCDFLMKNFDLRMQGYDQEVEALQQAKAILSGMASDEAGLD